MTDCSVAIGRNLPSRSGAHRIEATASVGISQGRNCKLRRAQPSASRAQTVLATIGWRRKDGVLVAAELRAGGGGLGPATASIGACDV